MLSSTTPSELTVAEHLLSYVGGTVSILGLRLLPTHPLGVALGGGFLATLPYLLAAAPLPLALFVGGVAYVMAANGDRRWARWALLGAGWLGLLLAMMAVGLFFDPMTSVRLYGFAAALVVSMLLVAVGVLVGGQFGARRRERGLLGTERRARAASEERLAVAQDLHDGVGHGLAVIAMHAGAALHVIDDDQLAVRRSLEAIREASRESLTQLRTSLASMTSEEAPRSPSRSLADLDALVERVRTGGLTVDLNRRGIETSPENAALAYAVVQEALTNTLRHAQADSVHVRLTRAGEELVVEVRDDGRAEPGAAAEGTGLASLAQRVEAAGGRFSATRGGGGFTVTAALPEATP